MPHNASARHAAAAQPLVLFGAYGRTVEGYSPADADLAEARPPIHAHDWQPVVGPHLRHLRLRERHSRTGVVGISLSRAARGAPYDAVALDIDNGPTAMVQANNSGHYRASGIQRIATALKPGGRAAIWSARPDHAFTTRLARAGLTVKSAPAKLYATAKKTSYTIYLADKPVSG